MVIMYVIIVYCIWRKVIRHSIVASIPACHAGDRGSIPRDGVILAQSNFTNPAIYGA